VEGASKFAPSTREARFAWIKEAASYHIPRDSSGKTVPPVVSSSGYF